ncbi:MAG: zinc-dependent metalloprotease [Euzebyales bacterium]|nr:zinc-dependent metalloprotease [Euzebyales bacterium]
MSDPFAGGFDPRMFANVPLFRELAKVMSWSGGPVNWDLATDTALAIAAPPDALPAVGEREAAEFAAAVGVAELWLDPMTALPAVEGPVRALAAAEWTRAATSSAGLGVYVEPVAAGMGGALAKGLPEGMEALGGQLAQAMGAMGSMLYGVQVGTVAGHLAGQLLGTYDLGLPTIDPRTVGTVGDTARRFAADYDFDPTEFRYWLALREAVHRRVFVGVPWLRPLIGDLIGRFAADAELDPMAMFEGLGGMGLDPSDPTALREALEAPDAFRIEPTAAQQETLARLQGIVAFVEGYCDTVVRSAADGRLTALPSIEEVVRRRRADKGPGERFLEQLVGLDLKPADFRLGQSFCDAVIAARDQEGLDRVWRDAGALPHRDELANPSGWLLRMAAADIEADLEADLGPLDEGDEPDR